MSSDMLRHFYVPITDAYFFQNIVSGHTKKSQYDNNASYFDLRKYKASFTINTHFPPLRQTLYASRDELFAEVSGLFTHCGSARRPQQGVHAGLPSGGQKDGSRWVLNLDRSTPLLLLLPLCADRWAVWCCHAGGRLHSSSYMAEPFQFVVSTALMLAYISL
jgi:hypothetical protein